MRCRIVLNSYTDKWFNSIHWGRSPMALIIGYAITASGFLLFFGPLSVAGSLKRAADRDQHSCLRCGLGLGCDECLWFATRQRLCCRGAACCGFGGGLSDSDVYSRALLSRTGCLLLFL